MNIAWFVLPQFMIAYSNYARSFDETLLCVGAHIHSWTEMVPDVAEQFHVEM